MVLPRGAGEHPLGTKSRQSHPDGLVIQQNSVESTGQPVTGRIIALSAPRCRLARRRDERSLSRSPMRLRTKTR
jgi:hypothetical protein